MKKVIIVSFLSMLLFSCSESNEFEPLPEGPSAEHPVIPEPSPEHPTVPQEVPTPYN